MVRINPVLVIGLLLVVVIWSVAIYRLGDWR